jgi:arylformamidase
VTPLRLCHVNEWLGLDPGADERLSPIHQIPDAGPPLVISWGGTETAEFKRQSIAYAEAWQNSGLPVTAFEEPDRNHFDIVLDLADRNSRLFRETERLIAAAARPR